MVKYRVEQSIIIAATKDVVYEKLINLHLWNSWSPWSCLDPDAVQKISDDNRTLSWDGKVIGSGKMVGVFADDKYINADLEFFKPFKSKAKVGYIVERVSDQETSVTWWMDSQLPWYMFFFKKFMVAMIGKDYNRGLNRLKMLCETGAIRAKMEFIDEPIQINKARFVGLKAHSNMDNLAADMTHLYQNLNNELAKQSRLDLGYGCTFCDKFSFIKNTMDYTSGFYYSGELGTHNVVTRDIPEHKAIKVRLIGRYEYLHDAWTAINMRCRAYKLKPLKNIPPYEVYINGPHNTDNPDDYITDIYMPIR